MINVEAEVNKHKNCRDRDELARCIQDYKNHALQYANDFIVAGQYNMVAFKLQEFYDKLPAPHLKNLSGNTQNIPVKTAKITREEKEKISTDWKRRAGNAIKGGKH